MAMNMIQFQSGLSLPEFLDLYGTEAKCRRALYRWRWPAGFRCPACGGRHRSSFRRGGQILYQCRACQHQATLISGTLLASTKLPLTTWLLAIYLLTSTKTNLAALELKRHLGVCYRTAWRLTALKQGNDCLQHEVTGTVGFPGVRKLGIKRPAIFGYQTDRNQPTVGT